MRYDPKHDQDTKCARPGCGHKYYRHFDTYDDMAPVGCKYCKCGEFMEPPDIFNELVSATCKCGAKSVPYPRGKWSQVWKSYKDTGYFPVARSDGGFFRLCPKCTAKVREHVKAITELTKNEDYISFTTLQHWLLKED